MLEKIENLFNKFADVIGYICMFVMILLISDVFLNVAGRYLFKYGNVATQELEWHFFSIIILLGLSYVLYEKFSTKTKSIINMFGTIFFILPLSFLVAWLSFDYVIEAYDYSEGSSDPGGLPYRWIIKAFIPFSFWLLIFFSIGYFIKHLNLYLKAKDEK